MTKDELQDTKQWWAKQTDEFKMDFLRMRNNDYPEYNSMDKWQFIREFDKIWREERKQRHTWPIKK